MDASERSGLSKHRLGASRSPGVGIRRPPTPSGSIVEMDLATKKLKTLAGGFGAGASASKAVRAKR
jgi:hypothetical protein